MSSTRKKRRRSSASSATPLSFLEDEFDQEKDLKTLTKRTKRQSDEIDSIDSEDISSDTSSNKLDDDDLYSIVSKKAALVPIIDDWIKLYKSKRNQATTKLVNFVLKSSSVDSVITESQFASDDEGLATKLVTTLAVKNVELHKEKSLDYPIASKKKESKKFRQSFSQFWQRLIRACSKEIIYDEFLIPHMTFWLVQFSRSTLRAFRHTATVAAFDISRELIKSLDAVKTQLEANQRLTKAEKKKNKNSAKYKDLTKKTASLSKNIRTIESYLTNVFNGIFVHRYRDRLFDIRIECISYFGDWIVEYPSMFLDNNYLKYVGWLLSDDDPRVRNNAIKVLLKLYGNKNLSPQMDKFSEYYKKRMSQLVMDVDIACSAAAMKLFAYLDEEEVLDEEALLNVYAHISHESPTLRTAAAQFVYHKFFEPLAKASSSEQLVELIRFIEERTPTPDIPNFCVDSLWSLLECLRDWDAMTELLLSDQEELSSNQQNVLSKILLCSVKKVFGTSILPSSSSKDTTTTKKEEDNRLEIISDYTTKLTKALPNLLKHYKGDQLVLEELVNIPLYFDLVTYSTFSSNKKAFRDFLKVLSDIFMSSTSMDTLHGISSTYAHLLYEEHAFRREAEVSMRGVVEKLNATPLSSNLDEELCSNEEDATEIIVFLRRSKALISNMDTTEMLDDKVFEVAGKAIELGISGDIQTAEIVSLSLYIRYYNILWKLSKPNLEENDLDDLNTNAHSFTSQLSSLLESEVEALNGDAFLILSDLLVLISSSDKINGQTLSIDTANKIKVYYENSMASPSEEYDFDEIESRHRVTQAFCKLILFNLLTDKSETFAPIIILHLDRHEKSIEELIKAFMKKLKSDVRVDFSSVLLDTLRTQYNLEKKDSDSSDSFTSLKSLSKRLVSTFGVGLVKKTEDLKILKSLAEDAINWVSKNLDERSTFLNDAIAPFISKMTKEVNQILLNHMESKWKEEIDDHADLQQFKNHLEGKVQSKGESRRKSHAKKADASMELEDDIEEFSEQSQEEPVRRRSSRRL